MGSIDSRLRFILAAIRGGNIGANEYRLLNLPRVSVYRNAGLATVNATNNIITWDTSEYNEDGIWDSSLPTRLSPRTPGVYQVTGWGTWNASAAGPRHMVFNRTTAAGVVSQFPSAGQLGNGADIQATLAGYQTPHGPYIFDVVLNVGDYIEMQVAQTSGGGLAWLASSAALRYNGFQARFVSSV